MLPRSPARGHQAPRGPRVPPVAREGRFAPRFQLAAHSSMFRRYRSEMFQRIRIADYRRVELGLGHVRLAASSGEEARLKTDPASRGLLARSLLLADGRRAEGSVTRALSE